MNALEALVLIKDQKRLYAIWPSSFVLDLDQRQGKRLRLVTSKTLNIEPSAHSCTRPSTGHRKNMGLVKGRGRTGGLAWPHSASALLLARLGPLTSSPHAHGTCQFTRLGLTRPRPALPPGRSAHTDIAEGRNGTFTMVGL